MNNAEINNETKERFFALYWGQEVAVTELSSFEYDSSTPELIKHEVDGSEIDYLELKPLSAISDEDAMGVAGMLGVWVDFKEYTEEQFYAKYSGGKECPLDKTSFVEYLQDIFDDSFRDNNASVLINMADFLRKKSYLIPFDGLSTEELIEAGWAKLKEREDV